MGRGSNPERLRTVTSPSPSRRGALQHNRRPAQLRGLRDLNCSSHRPYHHLLMYPRVAEPGGPLDTNAGHIPARRPHLLPRQATARLPWPRLPHYRRSHSLLLHLQLHLDDVAGGGPPPLVL